MLSTGKTGKNIKEGMLLPQSGNRVNAFVTSSTASVTLTAEMKPVHPYLKLDPEGKKPTQTWAQKAQKDLSEDTQAELFKAEYATWAKQHLAKANKRDELLTASAYRSYSVTMGTSIPVPNGVPLQTGYKNILEGHTVDGSRSLFDNSVLFGDDRIKLKDVFQGLVTEYNNILRIAANQRKPEQIHRAAAIRAYLLEVVKPFPSNAQLNGVEAFRAAINPPDLTTAAPLADAVLNFSNNLYKKVVYNELLRMIQKFNIMVAAGHANLSDPEKRQLLRLARELNLILQKATWNVHGNPLANVLGNATGLDQALDQLAHTANLHAITDLHLILISGLRENRIEQHEDTNNVFYFSPVNINVTASNPDRLLHEAAYDKVLDRMADQWVLHSQNQLDAAKIAHQTALETKRAAIKTPYDQAYAEVVALAEIYEHYVLTPAALNNGINIAAAVGLAPLTTEQTFVAQIYTQYNIAHQLTPDAIFASSRALTPNNAIPRTAEQIKEFKEVMNWYLKQRVEVKRIAITRQDISINPDLKEYQESAARAVGKLYASAQNFVLRQPSGNIDHATFVTQAGANHLTVGSELNTIYQGVNISFLAAQQKYTEHFDHAATIEKKHVKAALEEINPCDASMYRVANAPRLNTAIEALHNGCLATTLEQSRRVSNDHITAYYVQEEEHINETPKQMYNHLNPVIKNIKETNERSLSTTRDVLIIASRNTYFVVGHGAVSPERANYIDKNHTDYNLDFHTLYFLMREIESIDDKVVNKILSLSATNGNVIPVGGGEANAIKEKRKEIIKEAILYSLRTGGEVKFGSAYMQVLETQLAAAQNDVNVTFAVPMGMEPVDVRLAREANLLEAQNKVILLNSVKSGANGGTANLINTNVPIANFLADFTKERAEQCRRLLTWGQQRRKLSNETANTHLTEVEKSSPVDAAAVVADPFLEVRANVPNILAQNSTFNAGFTRKHVYKLLGNPQHCSTYTESGSKKILNIPVISGETDESTINRVLHEVKAFIDRGGLRDSQINLSGFAKNDGSLRLAAIIYGYLEAKYEDIEIFGIRKMQFKEHVALYKDAKTKGSEDKQTNMQSEVKEVLLEQREATTPNSPEREAIDASYKVFSKK